MNTPLPCEITTYIDTIIQHARCSQNDKNAIHQELTQHFEEIYAQVQEQNESTPNAQALIQDFGNPKDLAKLMTRGKRRVQNNTALNTSGLYGSTILVFSLLLIILLGGHLQVFINIPSFLAIISLTISLGVCSFGPACLKTIWKLRLTFYTPAIQQTQTDDIKILKSLLQLIYATAAICFFIGAIHLLYHFKPAPVSQSAQGMIAHHFGRTFLFQFTLLSPLYALLIAEIFLRPSIHRIQSHINKSNNDTKTQTENTPTLSNA